MSGAPRPVGRRWAGSSGGRCQGLTTLSTTSGMPCWQVVIRSGWTVPSTSILCPVTGVPCGQISRYTTPLLVSNVQPGSIPSDTVPLTRTLECLPVLVGGPLRSSGGPVGVVGIGFVLVVVAADVEIGAVGVDAEPRPDCSTEPQALRETSARTPARAAATALVILILTPCAPATFLWFIPILAPGAVPVLQERGPDRAPSVITGMSTSLMRACSGLSSQPWALPGRGVPTAGRSCGLGGVGLDGRGTRSGAAGQLTLDEHTWLDSVRAITSDLMPIRNCCTSPEVAARSRFGASVGPFSTSPFEP